MTDDVVTTTGRRMTRALEEALDDITGIDRRHAIEAMRGSDSPALGRVYRALAIELMLVDLRERDLFHRMTADRRASLPDPPELPAW
jgi:hypothetical protein